MFVEAQVIMIKCIIIIASSGSECCRFSVVLLFNTTLVAVLHVLVFERCVHALGREGRQATPSMAWFHLLYVHTSVSDEVGASRLAVT